MSHKVLVAEDDEGIRSILRTRLQAAGYEVLAARNGLEALQRIKSWRPDAVVLDVNMPEMDGFTVLKSLQDAAGGPPPTLILTARHAADDVKMAIGLGAKDYLAKPFSEGQLLARVARLLRHAPPPAPAQPARPPVVL
jgi:two-component system OmpR family response regulator